MEIFGRIAWGVLFVLPWIVPSPAGAQGAARPGEVATQRTGPPRDRAAGPAEGTAVLRGRILDADSGLPLRRVNVQARPASGSDSQFAITDDQGRFVLAGVASGEHIVIARKPGYVQGSFGQRRPGESPRPLAVRDGERLDRLDMWLWRGGVITGRIVDELGEPVLEATVQVMQQRWVNGRRRAVTTAAVQTNDLGVYRAFGLPPGDYLVSASSASRGFAAVAPTEYAPVFYPGTSDPAGARPVTVHASQETLVDLALSPVPVVRLSGIVVDGTGRPLSGGRVMARPRMSEPGLGFEAQRSGSIKPDGSFIVTGLTPGTWTVSAWQGRGFEGAGGREFARQDVEIADQPLDGLTLALGPGGTLRGRLVFEGPATDPGGFRLFARVLDPDLEMGGGQARPDSDATFEIPGLVGRYALGLAGEMPRGRQGAAGSDGWRVKAVIVGGNDVQDTGIDMAPGRTVAADVVLSRDFAEISGSATTDRGVPVADYSVLVFAEDREKWFLPSGRWVRSARSNQDGQFKVEGLTGGRYLVVAAESFDANAAGDPEALERLREIATEIRLGDREKKTLTLALITEYP